MNAAPERVHEPRRILYLLQQFRKRRVTLATRPWPSPITASTMVVEVSGGTVMLDALFPSPAQAAVHRGTVLEFSTRLDGIDVKGRLRVREVERRNDGDVVVAEVPRELLWSQKRSAYRVPALALPGSHLLVRGGRFRTRVIDLSVLGLGVEVAMDLALDTGSQAICELVLPGQQLIAGLEIRSAGGPPGRMRIGGKYLELSRSQRLALELATSRLQRDALQRQRYSH